MSMLGIPVYVRACLAGLVALAAIAPTAAAEWRVDVDPAPAMRLVKLDGKTAGGRVSLVYEDGFHLRQGDFAFDNIRWTEVSAQTAASVMDGALKNAGPADLVAAGRVLARLPDGKALAEPFLTRALQADPSVARAVEFAREGKYPPPTDAEQAARAAKEAMERRSGISTPVPIRVRTVDGRLMEGLCDGFSEVSISLLTHGGRVSTGMRWTELKPADQWAVAEKVQAEDRNPANWLRIAKVFLRQPECAALAEQAFAQVTKHGAAPELVTQARKQVADEQARAAAAAKVAAEAPKVWPKLTPQQQQQAVADLKQLAATLPRSTATPMIAVETPLFLVYTDLTRTDAARAAAMLDQLYARLAQLFGVEKGANIWAGKAMVILFKRIEDFRTFETNVMKTDMKENKTGYCHWWDDGRVLIAAFRSSHPQEFSHLLVHETVHGFVHRHRSPVEMPSWLGEGLAEVIAAELVPQPHPARLRRLQAQATLRSGPPGDAFFKAQQIANDQYAVAEALTAFLIARDSAAYVRFVNSVKDRVTVDEAIEKEFGMPRAKLVDEFVKAMGQDGTRKK